MVQENSKARVINSNKRVELRIKQFQEEKLQTMSAPVVTEPSFEEFSEEDGEFVDGITADVVEEVPQPDVESMVNEMLDSARAEADAIINEAKLNAEAIVNEASEQADSLFEEKKLEGYNEGLREKENELLQREQQLENEIQTRKLELEKEFNQYSEELENDIVDAVIKVYNKVFNIQFDDKKQILLALVKNTISNIEIGKEFKIRVSDNNYKFMKSHLGDIQSRIGNDVEVEIINDNKMGESDCQLETSFGLFDCGIDMELSNLEKAIRSLCN